MRWKTSDYSGWGRVLSARGPLARPERQSDLLALAAEDPGPAFGNHRSYGDACLNDGGRAVRMTRLDRILAFERDTGLITVEAGMTLGDLLAVTSIPATAIIRATTLWFAIALGVVILPFAERASLKGRHALENV